MHTCNPALERSRQKDQEFKVICNSILCLGQARGSVEMGEQETEKETRKSKEEADKQLPVQSSSANQTIHLHVPQFLLLEWPWQRQSELFGFKSLGAQQASKAAFGDLCLELRVSVRPP